MYVPLPNTLTYPNPLNQPVIPGLSSQTTYVHPPGHLASAYSYADHKPIMHSPITRDGSPQPNLVLHKRGLRRKQVRRTETALETRERTIPPGLCQRTTHLNVFISLSGSFRKRVVWVQDGSKRPQSPAFHDYDVFAASGA